MSGGNECNGKESNWIGIEWWEMVTILGAEGKLLWLSWNEEANHTVT